MSAQAGANILNAVAVVAATGEELESLKHELEGMLISGKKSDPVFFREEKDGPDWDTYMDSSGWVLSGWRWSFPAWLNRGTRGRPTKAGSFTVSVDIGRSDGIAQKLGFPCIVAAWSPSDESWDDDLDDAKSFWPRSDQTDELQANGRLFRRREDPVESDPAEHDVRRSAPAVEASWFYVLPLLAISGSGKLKSLLVEPLLGILAGHELDTVFKLTPEILRFDHLQGQVVLLGRQAT